MLQVHALWDSSAKSLGDDDLAERLLELRNWAVRQLTLAADLVRAIDIGLKTLTDCERGAGRGPPRHPDLATTSPTPTSRRATWAGPSRCTSRPSPTNERVLGADHPRHPQLAQQPRQRLPGGGRAGPGDPAARATLADRRRVLGADHPDTLTSANNLAGAYESAGDLDRAIPLYEPTLADRERVLGDDHPDTLTRGTTSPAPTSRRATWTRRSPCTSRPWPTGERVLGADHPDTLLSRNNLANAYESAGRPGRGDPAVRADPGRPASGCSAPTTPTP